MGSRAADKLREIEELRAGLDAKLGALEEKFPIGRWGRKGAAVLAGSGVVGSLFAARRAAKLLPRRRRKAPVERGAAQVVVNGLPRGTTVVVALGIAAWAGVRLYESYTRSHGGGREQLFRPAVVTPMPEADQRSAGS